MTLCLEGRCSIQLSNGLIPMHLRETNHACFVAIRCPFSNYINIIDIIGSARIKCRMDEINYDNSVTEVDLQSTQALEIDNASDRESETLNTLRSCVIESRS